jgi:hypothetical protein
VPLLTRRAQIIRQPLINDLFPRAHHRARPIYHRLTRLRHRRQQCLSDRATMRSESASQLVNRYRRINPTRPTNLFEQLHPGPLHVHRTRVHEHPTGTADPHRQTAQPGAEAECQNRHKWGRIRVPFLFEAETRVLRMQAKLHQWATDSPDRRFSDLFNLVSDPAFLVVAWHRVRGNRGARSAGIDGVKPNSIVFGDRILGELRDTSRLNVFGRSRCGNG